VKRSGRNSLLLFFFILTLWDSSLEANPSVEDLCEKLHAEYLLKAQKALSENKLEDALRLLVQADNIAKKCVDSSEQPLPQKQIRESGLASAPNYYSLS